MWVSHNNTFRMEFLTTDSPLNIACSLAMFNGRWSRGNPWLKALSLLSKLTVLLGTHSLCSGEDEDPQLN